jgi:hypothetical protein
MDPHSPPPPQGVKSESPQPEPARTGIEDVAPSPQGRQVARRYPKPPPFLKRLVLLVLKPEAWAAAAQYPFWVTLLPLLLALSIASAAVAVGGTARLLTQLDTFAQFYDSHYPTLHINSDGKLSVEGAATQPVDFSSADAPFLIDTTGKTNFDLVKGNDAVLITDHLIYQRFQGANLPPGSISERLPWAWFIPEKGQTTTIDTSHIQTFMAEYRPQIMMGAGFLIGFMKFIGEFLWVAITLFFIRPMIMVGAAMGKQSLVMPKRAAYRIGAALLVPVVLFGGIMQGLGYSAGSVVGEENGLIFWCFASGALAVWAGVMAKKMYAPKARGPRAM